jgi:hypothetical protein
MNTECGRFRGLIPRSTLGDLGADDKSALDRHVAECAPCRNELDLYANTLGQLNRRLDVDPPRHFFVYDAPARKTPWWLFRQMPVGWQAAFASAAVLCGIIVLAALTRLHVRTGDGSITIAFGSLPSPAPLQIPPPPVDTAALESRILAAVEQRKQVDSEQLLRTLRQEIGNSNRKMSRDQRQMLQTALDAVEARLASNVSDAVASVQARSDKSIADVYEAVTLQQQRDRSRLETRIDRLAVNGAAKSSETDAILQTLLEVAELRMK